MGSEGELKESIYTVSACMTSVEVEPASGQIFYSALYAGRDVPEQCGAAIHSLFIEVIVQMLFREISHHAECAAQIDIVTEIILETCRDAHCGGSIHLSGGSVIADQVIVFNRHIGLIRCKALTY